MARAVLRAGAMFVILPVLRGRISPVLDVAQSFLVLELGDGQIRGRAEVRVEESGLFARARHLAALGGEVLICGAVSRPFAAALAASGLRLIVNTCGAVDEVVAACLAGRIGEQACRMPGCCCRGKPRARRGRKEIDR